ncbi:MAG: calcium/sodium antiporter, partial [Myxococcota bacterium]
MPVEILDILFLIGGLVVLYFGAEAMVKGASLMALNFGISPLIVGLTVVAFGTSAPEFVVSFFAVIRESEAISVGNIVGSNICNIALILGVSSILAPLSVDAGSLRREYPIMLVASVLFYLFAYDGKIQHWEGGILFAGIIGFVAYNLVAARRLSLLAKRAEEDIQHGPEHEDGLSEIAVELPEQEESSTGRNILYLLGGIVGLGLGAQLMVEGATDIALALGISKLTIGITIIAFGTSLPELATCAVAAFRGESDISIGNVVGSNIFNILFIMGGIPMVFELPVEPKAILYDFPIMLGVMLIAFPIMRHQYRIDRPKGVFLLLIYISYTIFLFVR